MAPPSPHGRWLLLSSIIFLSACPCASQNVTVSIYYETLCPDSAEFIANDVKKNLFDNGLISIVNLRMVPWGNAIINPDGSFLCQHGPNECALNAIQACTITIYPDVERHFRFIRCVERMAMEEKLNEWVGCFDISGLGRVPIDCYRSGYGDVLERKYAAETGQLNPPHRFVPWVVVDNHPLQEDLKNFGGYVCKSYKGTQKIEACNSLPLPGVNKNNVEAIDPSLCYLPSP